MIHDPPRPSRSSRARIGSTFQCRVDAGALKACSSPFTTATLVQRRPQLLGQGDRRRRQPERDRLAIVHGRPLTTELAARRAERRRSRVGTLQCGCAGPGSQGGGACGSAGGRCSCLAARRPDGAVGGRRGGAVGVLRHRADGDPRRPGRQGNAGRAGADQPLRAQLGRGRAHPGPLQVGLVGPVHRRARLARDPGGALGVGQPELASGLLLDPADRRGPGRAAVARLPQGAGRPLPVGRHLLDPLLPQAIRGQRDRASGAVVADLERAQPEEVLRAVSLAGQVRAAAPDLLPGDQEQGPSRPGGPGRDARLR